jgi:hypothetical protein
LRSMPLSLPALLLFHHSLHLSTENNCEKRELVTKPNSQLVTKPNSQLVTNFAPRDQVTTEDAIMLLSPKASKLCPKSPILSLVDNRFMKKYQFRLFFTNFTQEQLSTGL